MKILISILLITIGLTSGVAQSEWGLGYQLKSGFLLAHRGNMANLPQQTAWASEFSFFRKVRSFFNAFFVDFIKPISSREIKLSRKIYILPFLIMITSIRFTKFISILIKTKI